MIVFRVDASVRMGNGHIARCLTLAGALRALTQRSVFVCRAGPGEPSKLIRAAGFEVVTLEPTDDLGMNVEVPWPDAHQAADARDTGEAIADLSEQISWIVSDHYGLGAAWEESLRSRAPHTLVIDDLANRPHNCDMLLDQNYYLDLDRRYTGLVPAGCRLVLGPRNVLLRPEFSDARTPPRKRDGRVRRILVAFGSSDEGGETLKALRALQSMCLDEIAIDVVTGASNPRLYEVRALCAQLRHCTHHTQVDYMAELIRTADLALGAGGSGMWERCALGLPTLTIITAANQSETTLATATTGAIVVLGHADAVVTRDLADAVGEAIANPERTREAGLRGMRLVPEADGAARLASAMTRDRTAAAQTSAAGHA